MVCMSRPRSACRDPVGDAAQAASYNMQMTGSDSLDGFLNKWRERWPEWSLVERFVAPELHRRSLAWFALLQEFDDMLNIAGDPLPANAKLGWWGEELRSWAAQRSRHPLGRVLEPVRGAPWAQLAEALPALIDAREPVADAAQARRSLQGFAEAVAAVEAVMFAAPLHPHAADAVLIQTLAQRVQELDATVVPAKAGGVREWQQALLAQWPARVAGPRPRHRRRRLAGHVRRHRRRLRRWRHPGRSDQGLRARGGAVAGRPRKLKKDGRLARCCEHRRQPPSRRTSLQVGQDPPPVHRRCQPIREPARLAGRAKDLRTWQHPSSPGSAASAAWRGTSCRCFLPTAATSSPSAARRRCTS